MFLDTFLKEKEVIKESTPAIVQSKRLVYLAGPAELEDTWRERATKSLSKMGLEALNPLRNEKLKVVGKHIESDIPDSLIVMRDLYDLQRCKFSGGFCLMNLSTSKEGRKPIGTLFELQWCWDNRMPVIAIMGKDCALEYKTHPWIKTFVSYEATSLKNALELIELYFV